jgi:hypothetical protein
MSVTSVHKDYDNLTLTAIAEFDAPIAQVWELWSDPRKLERWWGPPGYPATFEKHDVSPGGEVTYFESREDMEKLVEMGMAEGLQQAIGQMGALLA